MDIVNIDDSSPNDNWITNKTKFKLIIIWVKKSCTINILFKLP